MYDPPMRGFTGSLLLIHEHYFRVFTQQPLDADQRTEQTGFHVVVQMALLVPLFNHQQHVVVV